MFSQLRQAVETFAPQPRRSIDEQRQNIDTDNVDGGYARRPQSLDTTSNRSASPLASTQLVDSALMNLRKSLSSGRMDNPSPATSPSHASMPTRNVHMSLEERLRASFHHGDVPYTGAQDGSHRPPRPPNEQPLSPTSTPLPSSPPSSALLEPVTESGEAKESSDTKAEHPVTDDAQAEEEYEPKAAEEPARADEVDASSPPLPSTSTPEAEAEAAPSTSTLDDLLPTGSGPLAASVDVEALQERLKLVEQRFSDVSKRLQAEKIAADAVLRELTPLEGFKDSDALRDYLKSTQLKQEISQQELVRLTKKIVVQDERLEEIRDTHRLESKSQSEQIETLKARLAETEALFNASQTSISLNEADSMQRKADTDRLLAEIAKSQTTAKEEEEKRVKAVSLLKTVRQKLVKAEKEREEALKETTQLREKDKVEKEKDATEKARLRKEIESANTEREKAVAGIRQQFEKELANVKEKYERELVAQRGQFELDAVTTKSAYGRDLANKTAHISQLQASLDSVTLDKNTFFEQLQLRQAESESAQSLLEATQSRYAELQYRFRELEDHSSLLQEELSEAQLGHLQRPSESSISSDDFSQMVAAKEAKYEMRVGELQRSLAATERERNDIEAEWSRKLKEKTKETDELKRLVGSTDKLKEDHEAIVDEMGKQIDELRKERVALEMQRDDMLATVKRASESEATIRSTFSELDAKVKALEQQIEESRARESQLRLNNKTLREELRKVQSSAALLEKQRNPGVGYWTHRAPDSQTDLRSSTSSDGPSRTSSPKPDSSNGRSEEDVNVEYLRNVILQFLEHKEMRPNLVKVLSIILRFTPQETRRLMAKV